MLSNPGRATTLLLFIVTAAVLLMSAALAGCKGKTLGSPGTPPVGAPYSGYHKSTAPGAPTVPHPSKTP